MTLCFFLFYSFVWCTIKDYRMHHNTLYTLNMQQISLRFVVTTKKSRKESLVLLQLKDLTIKKVGLQTSKKFSFLKTKIYSN